MIAVSAAALAGAAVGAGADRLLARRQAQRDSAAAERLRIAAVRRQAQLDAQDERQALHRTSDDAARDKAAALEQMKAQLPSGHDRTISKNFDVLSGVHPWLAATRRSVGYFECYAQGMAYRGAAEILDSQGTLVLCGHEFVAPPQGQAALFVTFFLSPTVSRRFPIRMLSIDRDKDIAFAALPPTAAGALLQRNGLAPVRWEDGSGHGGGGDAAGSGEVIFVGFPEGIARLHATSGTVRALRKVNTFNGDGAFITHACKMETSGVTFSGMSGGGVFQEGRFKGIINFSTPAGAAPNTYFTPAQAIAAAYVNLFPDRARASGVAALAARAAAPGQTECAFDRRSFLTLKSRPMRVAGD